LNHVAAKAADMDMRAQGPNAEIQRALSHYGCSKGTPMECHAEPIRMGISANSPLGHCAAVTATPTRQSSSLTRASRVVESSPSINSNRMKSPSLKLEKTTPTSRITYKIKDAAEMTGTSPITIRRLISRGILKHNRVTRHVLIPATELHRVFGATPVHNLNTTKKESETV
jgi:excisionase family DNA binding protein